MHTFSFILYFYLRHGFPKDYDTRPNSKYFPTHFFIAYFIWLLTQMTLNFPSLWVTKLHIAKCRECFDGKWFGEARIIRQR